MFRWACAMSRVGLMVVIGLGSAAAQSKPQGVPVTGTVLDPSRTATSDATVTLRQGPDSVVSSVTSDASGKFRFDAVPDGTYSIEVQHDGFRLSVTPLRVRANPPAPLTIVLTLAQLVSEVSVNGDEPAQISTEIAENRDAASVDQDMLERMPVFDQDYVAAMSAFLDAASMGTGGPQLMVNGVEATTVPVSASAIQEVRINQNPYSADIARPGRGTIEIITKEGTTAYHATLNFIFRDSALNAQNPFAATKAPEQRRILEGMLSGPVGHSQNTSFLLSGHRQEEDLQSTVFAQGLSGPIQESVPSPRRDSQLSVRVGHQFRPEHAVYWQYNEWDYPSSNQGVGGFVLPEAATNSKQWERELLFNDRMALSLKWLIQSQILFGMERHDTFGVSSAPKIVVQDAFTSGGAQTDRLDTEKHVQLNEIVSYASGKHVVKFGLNVPDWSRRGIVNHNNLAGTYFFSSLQNFSAQLPYAFRQQQGSGEVVYWQKEMGLFVQDDFRVRPSLSLSVGLRYNWQNYLHENTQFAPRFAFAYSPDQKRKIVFRGGAGIFYDRTGAGPPGDLLLYDGQRLRNILITDPLYPNPFAGGGTLGAQPSDIVQFNPALREPYTIQYSFGVERQLARRTTIAATYIGARGIGLFLSRNINAPLGPDYLVVPNPALGVVRDIESTGRQVSNSFEVTLRGELTHRLTGLVQYTLSHTENNTGGVNWFPANQYDLTGEWARADFDQRHRLNLLEGFNPGKSFTLGIGLTLASGKPYTLTTGQDTFHTGLANARPAGVPRNTLEGPGYKDVDLRLSRDFYLNRETKDKGKVFTVAFDAFNVFNHLNYTAYVGDLSSPFFGRAVSALPSRRLQLTGRFKF